MARYHKLRLVAPCQFADKLDSLVGLFGIDQPPTGTKDPFGLRRAALGVLRIIVEGKLDLDLEVCLRHAYSLYAGKLSNEKTIDQVLDYMLDRFRSWYEEEGIAAEVFLAVHARRPTRPLDFHRRVLAVAAFIKLPESQSLAAANKRVSNLLTKQSNDLTDKVIQPNRFELDAEKQLYETMEALQQRTQPLFDDGDYEAGLCQLAELSASVNRFFDDVMVMTDDVELRNNRLTLLSQLRGLFLNVADISLLPQSTITSLDERLHIINTPRSGHTWIGDGVINYDSEHYIKSAAEWRPLPGSIDAIQKMLTAAIPVTIATNQSGIARGYFNVETLNAMHSKLRGLLAERGIDLASDAIEYCPHGPDDYCHCRKPKPAMIQKLLSRFAARPDRTWVVGDSLRDLQAGAACGCQLALVRTGKGEKTLSQLEDSGIEASVYPDLAAFVAAIIQ